MTNETFTLGGRSFVRFTRAEDMTAEQEDFITAHIRPSGLYEATIAVDEDAEGFLRRLLLQVSESGKTFEVLSALLMPVDTSEWPGASTAFARDLAEGDWTPAVGLEVAKFIRRLKAEEDKDQIRQLLSALVMDFFGRAITSLYDSRNASAGQQAGDRETTTETTTATADPDAGAAGLESSELSQETSTAAPG